MKVLNAGYFGCLKYRFLMGKSFFHARMISVSCFSDFMYNPLSVPGSTQMIDVAYKRSR